jgi:hypothetical protein
MRRGLVEQVQLRARAGEDVRVAGLPQPAHQCGADHAAMAGDDHFGNQFGEADFWRPSEFLARLGGVAEQGFHFGGPEVARIDLDDAVALLRRSLFHRPRRRAR